MTSRIILLAAAVLSLSLAGCNEEIRNNVQHNNGYEVQASTTQTTSVSTSQSGVKSVHGAPGPTMGVISLPMMIVAGLGLFFLRRKEPRS